MAEAAASALLGTHDFSTFRAAECQARSPVRTMTEATVRRQGDWLVFDFAANAFLQHMIRNLVGALVHIGKGGSTCDGDGVIGARSAIGRWRRRRSCRMAWYLTRVDYDAVWQLPSTTGQGLSGDPLQIFNF